MVDDELHRHFNEQLAAMGAFLDGRVTYELMAEFWPTADQDPDSSRSDGRVRPHLAGHAQDRLLPDPRRRPAGTPTWSREVVVEEVLALKSQPGGDLALGGADLADTFRRLRA